jgi:hypothetical protein
MFGQTGRWAGKGSKLICSPRPKKHGGRPNRKPMNAYCNVVQCHAMSMSHRQSHALWRHVVRCGAMWRNVVQCGAMWQNVVRCGIQMNSYWVFVMTVQARKFLRNFTKISVE